MLEESLSNVAGLQDFKFDHLFSFRRAVDEDAHRSNSII
jgi:hypothetical protein